MRTYRILSTGRKVQYKKLNNNFNFSSINWAHIGSNITMFLKGYIPIKKEFFREGNDAETKNQDILNKYCEEYRKAVGSPIKNGLAFDYTTSAIDYKNIFSNNLLKKVFIEKTPVIVAWSIPKKSEVLDIITEKH